MTRESKRGWTMAGLFLTTMGSVIGMNHFATDSPLAAAPPEAVEPPPKIQQLALAKMDKPPMKTFESAAPQVPHFADIGPNTFVVPGVSPGPIPPTSALSPREVKPTPPQAIPPATHHTIEDATNSGTGEATSQAIGNATPRATGEATPRIAAEVTPRTAAEAPPRATAEATDRVPSGMGLVPGEATNRSPGEALAPVPRESTTPVLQFQKKAQSPQATPSAEPPVPMKPVEPIPFAAPEPVSIEETPLVAPPLARPSSTMPTPQPTAVAEPRKLPRIEESSVPNPAMISENGPAPEPIQPVQATTPAPPPMTPSNAPPGLVVPPLEQPMKSPEPAPNFVIPDLSVPMAPASNAPPGVVMPLTTPSPPMSPSPGTSAPKTASPQIPAPMPPATPKPSPMTASPQTPAPMPPVTSDSPPGIIVPGVDPVPPVTATPPTPQTPAPDFKVPAPNTAPMAMPMPPSASGPQTMPPLAFAPQAPTDAKPNSPNNPVVAPPTTTTPAPSASSETSMPQTPLSTSNAPKPPSVRLDQPMPSGFSGNVAPAAGNSLASSMSNEAKVDGYFTDLHPWQPNDSFAAISQRYYLDEGYAAALAAYNRDHPADLERGSADPSRMMLGQKVGVPPIWVLRKKYPNLVPAPGAILEAKPSANVGVPTAPVANPSVAPTMLTSRSAVIYTVSEPGEMLRDIARKTLGNGEQWRVIYDMNRSINPAERIPGGTRLRLPAEARW